MCSMCNSLSRERNLDAQLCRDLNPAARDIVDKHLSTRPLHAVLPNTIADVTLYAFRYQYNL